MCVRDHGKSADAVMVIVLGQPEKYYVRQATHCSGNPCPEAYDNTQ